MPDQRLSIESDAPTGADGARPIRGVESDVASRLLELIGDEPHAAFARRVGVGETTLRKYLGGADPSTSRLVAIADTTNVSLEWLAAGRGPKERRAAPPPAPHPIDLDRLRETLWAVEEGLRNIRRTLPPDKYAQLVVAAYNLMGQPKTDSANVVQFIKAAA
jgi:transcriptional regulator with XRE-family HTH domain